jgi:hypothetical protein
MTLKCEKNKLKLLKIEVPDRYVQENFKRIEQHAKDVCSDLKNLETGSGNGGDTIINVNGAWTKTNNSVPASTTKVIETVGLSTFHNIEYILTFYNEVEGKTRKLQMTTIREGVTIKTSVHGRLGSMTGISVNGNVNAGNFELEVINNNIYQIEVSYARLTL